MTSRAALIDILQDILDQFEPTDPPTLIAADGSTTIAISEEFISLLDEAYDLISNNDDDDEETLS